MAPGVGQTMHRRLPREKAEAMENQRDAAPSAVAAALEHLTGPSRGTVTWLRTSALNISLSPGRFIHVSEARPGEPRDDLVARLLRAEDTYEIAATEALPIWVNGDRVVATRLKHGDMIEFGESGPLSRFWCYGDDCPVRKTIPDILSDSVAYLRASRQPVANRVFRASGALVWQLTRKTTILFRAVVVVALVFFAALAYQQHRLNIRLQQGIESGAARLDSVAAALARAGQEALRPSDLTALREELGQRLYSAAERLEALEQRSQASGRVVAASMSSVAFAVPRASSLTSLATTAKPLPNSPARAASMVALSASRLVWLAMSLISTTTSPTFFAPSASCWIWPLTRVASSTASLAILLEFSTCRPTSWTEVLQQANQQLPWKCLLCYPGHLTGCMYKARYPH